MANILIITPMYRIEGREELKKDSDAIHYLVQPWIKNNRVCVINAYINGIGHVSRFKHFHVNQIGYYYHGYKYNCDGVPVLMVERQNLLKDQINGFTFSGNRCRKIIYKELEKENFSPDVIVCHMPSTTKFIVEKISYSCNKIAVLHSTDVRYLKKQGRSYIEYLQKNFVAVFCRSKSIYDLFKSRNLENLQEEIIYSGVPKQDYNIKEKNNTVTKILYVGKLISRKNVDILIKALSQIDKEKWTLNIIGDGDQKNALQKLVNEFSLCNNVKFLGSMPRNNVFEYMRDADVFCMPSVKETLGLVYLEAMSCGCITIGTKNEGIEGIIVDGENGYLIEPEEQKLIYLLNHIMDMPKDEKNRIINGAVDTAKYYNTDDVAQRYLDLVLGCM